MAQIENKDLAIKFIERFCALQLDELADLLAEDMALDGSLYQCQSREAYLLKLKNDPPELARFSIVSINEKGNTVKVIYDYLKTTGVIRITQVFQLKNNLISEMQIHFDTNCN